MVAAQLQTTIFGQLVRLLSGNKLLRYPDEIDPSLWNKSGHQDTGSTSTPTEEQTHGLAKESDTQGAASQNTVTPDGQEIQLVDWYGPDDPEMCILNFAVYIASSIYTPGEQSFIQEFGASETVATLGLSLFTLGYGLGPMLWSPMSEMPKLGRSGIFFWTLLAFILLQLPVGFAPNVPVFLVFRLLSGFCGSPCLATGAGTITDMLNPALATYAVCIWSSFGIGGPVFGPLIGGFVVSAKGWRWTIWTYTWACSVVLITLFFLFPETSAPNILYKRAKRLRKATGNDRLRSQSEINAAHHTMRDDLIVLARAFTLAFFEPIVLLMDTYTALLYGVLFTWFESFPIVFGDIYGFSISQQGLVFLGIFIGALVTVPLFLVWVKYGIVSRFTKPNFKPEMVLPPTFFGCFALPICLFWYGWSSRQSVHWIVPIIGSSLFAVAVITLFNPVFNYLGIAYPSYAASIFAGNALFRASFGAGFPLFARALFHHLGVGPGNSLLGGIAACFIPIPFIFNRYGEKIRHMSKNARHDV
ncbi:MAG: hypothetical protein M1821_002514 [Bathelium mastoideum]|nr:MAG: hypothetical protein M1821_002514 [Bathelium mastoideum]